MELDNIATEISPKVTKSSHRISKYVSNKFYEGGSNIYGSVFRYLIVIIKVAYYTCVIPFCIKKSQRGFYKIHSNKVQTVLTFITNGVICGLLFRNTISKYIDSDINLIEKPEAFIGILSKLSKIPKFLILFYAFWTKKRLMKTFLYLPKDNLESGNRKILLVNVLVLLSIFGSVASSLYGYGVVNNFFLSSSVNETINVNQLVENLSVGKKIFDVLNYPISLYSDYIEELFICLNFISAIMIYHICKTFVNLLKSNETDISQVAQHYYSVRETTATIREFFGPFVFAYTLEMLFICLHFPFAFRGGQLFATVLTSTYVAKFFITILIASEASLTMKYSKEWLFQYKVKEVTQDYNSDEDDDKNSKLQRRRDFENLKNAYEITKVGLGCKLFTFTYGFLGLFISVLATYGAFQLQFYNVAENAEYEDSAEITNETETIFNVT